MSTVNVGDVFSMEDENGQEEEIVVLALVHVEEIEYAAVAFSEDVQDDTKKDIDVFLLSVGENDELFEIEEDAEFEKVSNAFQLIQINENLN